MKHNDFRNEINVYNLYNHVSTRENEALEVLTVLEQHVLSVVHENGPGGDVYIVGDFNIPLSPHPYHPPRQARLIARLKSLMRRCNLQDINANLDNLVCTWRGRGQRSYISSRIDFILTNVTNEYYNKSINISNPFSDHSVVLLYHEAPFTTQREKYFNNLILKSAEFKTRADSELARVISEHSEVQYERVPQISDVDNPALLQEMEHGAAGLLPALLQAVREVHDQIEIERGKMHAQLEKAYQKAYTKICSNIDKNPRNPQFAEELDNLLESRKQEVTESTKRSQDLYDKITARDGGTSAPSTFLPFKFKQDSKAIHELHIDGVVYDDPQEILEQMSKFHAQKVGGVPVIPDQPLPPLEEGGEDPIDMACQQLGLDLEDIIRPQDDGLPMELVFEVGDVREVVSTFKNFSSPGPSGHSKAFLEYLLSACPQILTKILNIIANMPDLQNTPFDWIKKRKVIFLHKKTNLKLTPRATDLLAFLRASTNSFLNCWQKN